MKTIIAILLLLPAVTFGQVYDPVLIGELVNRLESEVEMAKAQSTLAKVEQERAQQQTAAMRETLWLTQSEQRKALKERDAAISSLAIEKAEKREALAARAMAEAQGFWAGILSVACAFGFAFTLLYLFEIPKLHPWALAACLIVSGLFAGGVWLAPFFLATRF